MRRAPDDICRFSAVFLIWIRIQGQDIRQALLGDQGPEGKIYARQMFNKISTQLLSVTENVEPTQFVF